MKLIEKTATALVRFTGLGIICFNPNKLRGEIAIIRDEKHTLSIAVQSPVFREGKDVIVYKNLHFFENLPKNNVEISIETKGNSAIKGYQKYQKDENFDRLSSEVSKDFRWIVNIDSLHNEKLSTATTQDCHPITKLFIENGLFYTHSLDDDLYFEKVQIDADGNEIGKTPFGTVGETIGVKLEADAIILRIKVDGKEEIHELPKVEGFPLKIEIKNMDTTSEEPLFSDMCDYHKFLQSSTGHIFDLKPIIPDISQGGSITNKQYCHPTESDIDSIDGLRN